MKNSKPTICAIIGIVLLIFALIYRICGDGFKSIKDINLSIEKELAEIPSIKGLNINEMI